MFASAIAALSIALVGQAPANDYPGQLRIQQNDGSMGGLCPLEGTDVKADISGFGVRVDVVQTFKNPTAKPIEAVYTFPLSATGAVDKMRMQVGGRIIDGLIKPQGEARQIYEAAKAQGQVASLLDQERPNIFTQSVANIMPGAKVKVQISYVELMKYDDGQFEFDFPMTVAPRYTGNTVDPQKISPPITPEGTHTGSKVHLSVRIDAGAPIQGLKSVLHRVNVDTPDQSHATVSLAKDDEVANRDFILHYRTATDKLQSAFITQMDPAGKGGFFTLILTPPVSPRPDEIVPREVIFVMDVSGSQHGFPLEKGKELDTKLIKSLRPGDTFNVYQFNTIVEPLWPESRPNSAANVAQALGFIQGMQAGGGTDINAGLLAVFNVPENSKRVRLVVFETDGLIGNENVVLDSIQKRRGKTARIFTFGVGNSVNRFLIDAMSQEGKGDSEIVTLAGSADPAVERFLKRTQSPVLTDVSAQFSGAAGVQDVLPSAIPDVFDQKPIVLCGRFSQPGHGSVVLSGNLGSAPWRQNIDLNFTSNAQATALPSIWARKKIDELTSENYLDSFQGPDKLKDQIVDVALEYGLMSQYTSFVAVEPTVVNINGKMRTIHVPVEMADGLSYEMTVGQPLFHGTITVGNVLAGARPGFFGNRSGGAGSASGAMGGYGGGATLTPGQGLATNGGYKLGVDRDKNGQIKASPEEIFKAKVEKSLRSATKKMEVQIWLTDLDDKTKKALESAGLHLEGSAERLKIVFGTCDAAALKALAKLDQVERIELIGS